MDFVSIVTRVLEWSLDHLEVSGGVFLLGVGIWAVRSRGKRERKAKLLLQKAVKAQTNEPLTLHPEVNASACMGCGACTRVCPEGDILSLVNHKAVLVSPSKCVGHGECERACPTGAISLVFGTKTRGMDIPRITSHYETNVRGLYIAGELGGMGLIRNAIKQGAAAASHALDKLPKGSDPSIFDLLIVGAGPAGMAAAMVAVQKKRTYLVLEQNSFGGTVYNFPRQKIVMTIPAELPLAGTMRFKKNKVSKEELLEYWSRLRDEYGLRIEEHTKFEKITPRADFFEIETQRGIFKAKKVILAMGVRGSPRKLGLANEDLPKVTYNLLDPQQYQGVSVAVVGGGNAGVEAAQYLARGDLNNKVTLLVRGPSFDRCNEENQKLISDLAQKGRVQIWFNASVSEIQPTHIVVEHDKKVVPVPNDYLFVFAGAEVPHKMLMSFGIQIDKKFGEALKKVG